MTPSEPGSLVSSLNSSPMSKAIINPASDDSLLSFDPLIKTVNVTQKRVMKQLNRTASEHMLSTVQQLKRKSLVIDSETVKRAIRLETKSLDPHLFLSLISESSDLKTVTAGEYV